MDRAQNLVGKTTSCTCMNNTSRNQPKLVQELEIPAPRGKEWQHGMGAVCYFSPTKSGQKSDIAPTHRHQIMWGPYIINLKKKCSAILGGQFLPNPKMYTKFVKKYPFTWKYTVLHYVRCIKSVYF